MSWFDGILQPIMVVVSYIMYGAHAALDWLGLDGKFGYDGYLNADGSPLVSGLCWVLSVVALVIVMRTLMIPLFVKQINAQRGLQLMQPEMKRIQQKYKDKKDPASRQKMQEEMQALYRKAGTNPLSSCWPILLQSPFFFALFRVLSSLKGISDGSVNAIGPIDKSVALSFEGSSIFGAPMWSTFMNADQSPNPVATRVVTVLLIVLMSATTFTTQRQLTMKNMPSQEGNPMASQQKMLLYAMPLIFAFSGINFPIGVLVYWLTTNLWTMGQQFFVIRKRPAPGSEAEKKLKERQRLKAERKGIVIEGEAEVVEAPRGQRVQPKRKDRQRAAQRGTVGQASEFTTTGVSGPVTEGAVKDDAGESGEEATQGAADGAGGSGGTTRPSGQRVQPSTKKSKKKR